VGDERSYNDERGREEKNLGALDSGLKFPTSRDAKNAQPE